MAGTSPPAVGLVPWTVAALAGGIVIGTLASRLIFTPRRWSGPTRAVAETVNRFIGDDWSARAPLDGADEVRRLARQVNALGEHADARITAISDETASLKLLVDALPDPIILVDARERVVMVNAPCERLLEIPPRQIIGRPFVTAVHDPAILDLFEACTHGQDPRTPGRPRRPRPTDREIKLLRRGQRMMYQAHAEPTHNGGVLVVLRDVSTLAATMQMKNDFVANASHELRTPISAIKVAFETLREVYHEQSGSGLDEPLGQRCMSIIGDHLRRLEEMLRDLLDLSRVESADLQPNLAPVRTRELFANLRSVWGSAARDKGVELVLPDPEGDFTFTSDRRLLDLVLKNLVENAIKFTPAGGSVEVGCEQRPAEAPGGRDAVVISVADTGCGIPPEHVERVFERFYQVDSARSGSAGRGTGLGLAIVKHAVLGLGGQVTLTSRLGVGTRFICTLPRLDTEEN